MKKLNDEQLSRVLSAHASAQLSGPRYFIPVTDHRLGCLIQVALNTNKCGYGDFDENIAANIGWYDSIRNDIDKLTSEEFLNRLEMAGIA